MATEPSFLNVCCGERRFSTQINCVVSSPAEARLGERVYFACMTPWVVHYFLKALVARDPLPLTSTS